MKSSPNTSCQPAGLDVGIGTPDGSAGPGTPADNANPKSGADNTDPDAADDPDTAADETEAGEEEAADCVAADPFCTKPAPALVEDTAPVEVEVVGIGVVVEVVVGEVVAVCFRVPPADPRFFVDPVVVPVTPWAFDEATLVPVPPREPGSECAGTTVARRSATGVDRLERAR